MKRIEDMENRFKRRPTIRIAAGLALRLWVNFAIDDMSDLPTIGFSANPESREYLYRANQVIYPLLRKNESDLRLFWLGIYFAIELRHFDRANEMLDNAYAYRSFYKNKQPFDYKVLLFLYSYLEIKQKRAKSAKKHMRALEASGNLETDPILSLLVGMLHLAFYDYDDAYRCLLRSYNRNCRSVFLFASLIKYYRTATRGKDKKHASIQDSRMLLQTIHWALNHKADVEDIVVVYQDELLNGEQIALGERIYQKFPNQWILKELCTHYMMLSDFGPKAYSYYRDAERRQIFLPNLSYFLVRSAFENNAERIHHYTMAQFLRKSDNDIPLMIYTYHLLLTDPNLSDLAADRVTDILKMAMHCLKNDIRSRYANSLYYFFWIKCNETQNRGKDVGIESDALWMSVQKDIEDILWEDLCKFEIVDPKGEIRYLYVNEWEKKEITECEIPSNGAPLIIEAVGNGFRYTGLSEGHARVLDNRLEIRRRVASANVSLYRHFYKRGFRSFELLAYLAKQPKENETSIFEAILTDSQASKAFKTQCSVVLGKLHYNNGKLDLALEYYAQADENDLSDELLEHMLQAYVQQKAWEKAAALVKRKWEQLGEEVLFQAVKMLASEGPKICRFAIAKASYRLLIASKYNKNLLDVVLECFDGSWKEWLDLSRVLFELSVHEPKLDEIVLKNATWSHRFDKEAQRIFIRSLETLSSGLISESIIHDFIYYAIYEMIVGKTKPLPETITALEKLIDVYEDRTLLSYGLTHVYLIHEISTAHSDEIIQTSLDALVKTGILFPVFKESKRLTNSYIEKYRPFMYKTLPGKDVRLYYKVDGEEDWRSRPMIYWRFGLYMICVPHFYNERLTFYFSEELPTGSITTREDKIHNGDVYLDSDQSDPFFIINNATIYEHMFRYEQVEDIIGGLVKDVRTVRSKLI